MISNGRNKSKANCPASRKEVEELFKKVSQKAKESNPGQNERSSRRGREGKKRHPFCIKLREKFPRRREPAKMSPDGSKYSLSEIDPIVPMQTVSYGHERIFKLSFQKDHFASFTEDTLSNLMSFNSF